MSELSFTWSEKFLSILPSATIISPASSSTISPGTISRDGSSCFTPSLITFAFGDESCFKLSSERSAFTCCTVPSTAFMTSTAKITMVLSILSENIEMTAAMISMITSRSQNWLRNTCNVLFLLPSWRTFSPFSLRISSARSVDSPRLSVLNSFSNSSPEQFQKFFSVIHTRLLFFLISVNRLCVSCKEKGTRPSLHDKHTIKVSFLSSSIYTTIYTPKACAPVPCTGMSQPENVMTRSHNIL